MDTTSYFDRAADDWARHYDAGGSMSPRVRRFVLAVHNACHPGTFGIDFGCGTGEIASALSCSGYTVVGLDSAPRMIETAVKRFGSTSRLSYRHVPPNTSLPVRDADWVIASSVFEYLDDVPRTFSILHDALKPGGMLFLTVPSPLSTIRRIEALLRPLAVTRLNAVMPSRLRNYLDYLATSKNRWSAGRWIEEAKGFAVRKLDGEREPLTLLTFRAV